MTTGPGFTKLFGGSSIYPSLATFLSLSISSNVTLAWPVEQASAGSPVAADIIEVSASVGGLSVSLSNAMQTTTGYTALFNNIGSTTFTVKDVNGNTLMTVGSGQVWQIYLADNSTTSGTWRVFQYGAGTSSTNAATLAGAGLKAITTTLNERIVISTQTTNYTIVNADRANCIDWTGGTGTFTLPNAATVGSDWFCIIKNSGSGNVTVSPPSGTIDSNASKIFQPGDSAFVVTDGTNYITIGFGQATITVFDFVSIDLSGLSGNVPLTGAQLNRVSYRFTGAIAGDVNVIVPATIQQYWVDNETSGAHALTVKTASGTGTGVSQGSRNILYCDGTNVVVAVTFGSTGFNDGTSGSPSIFFTSNPGTGVYKPATNSIGISTAGVERWAIDAKGHETIFAPDDATAPSLQLNGPSSGSGIVARLDTSFTSTAALPILALRSTAAGGFAGLSLTSNNGTIGTTDLALFQNGSTGESQLVNRHSTGHLKLGANSIIGIDIDAAGSAALSNVPTAPTPAPADNSTKIATTAFVTTAIAPLAPLASPAFTGTPTAPTPGGGDNSTKLATTAFVAAAIAPLAPLASPGLTGTPTAPTAAVGTSTTQIATTAFANPGQSLANPGYCKLPGGLILQWGTCGTGSGNDPADFAVTFPIAFSTGVFFAGVVSNRNVAGAGQSLDGSNYTSNYTTTGMTVTIDNSAGNPSSYIGRWFAVGV